MYLITQANDRPQQVGLRGFSAPPPPCDLKSIMDAESGRDAIRLALRLNPVRGYVKGSPARIQLEEAFESVPPRFASDLATQLKEGIGPLGKCFCYRLATPTRETMLKILKRKKGEFEVETQKLCERYKRWKEKDDTYKQTCIGGRRGFKIDYEKCEKLQTEAQNAPMPHIPPDVNCP